MRVLADAEYDPKKLLKAFKKEFACNGTIVDDEELGQIIQLQGDQRQKISMFLYVCIPTDQHRGGNPQTGCQGPRLLSCCGYRHAQHLVFM